MKKTIEQRIDYHLFRDEHMFFNTLSCTAPFISFFWMQMIRLFMLCLVFVIWCLNVYINVRKCIIYINIWALTHTLLAMGFLFISSGKQMIEKKLEERGEPLTEKEKSSTWKIGVILYAVAFPFVVTTNLLFFVLYKDDLIEQVEE